MLLFARHAIAGAHDAALVAAALADAYAALGGLREISIISKELKCCFRVPRGVVRPLAQILVELVGLDQLAGIHSPLGIPCGLELAESLHQLGAEHLGPEFGSRLS